LFSSKFKSLEFLHGHALVFLSPGLSMVLGYSLSHIIGGGTGTIAKIMVSATDDVLKKYIYKDTLARNLAAIIYRATSVVF
jgi:thimet oligopeptidase